MHLCAAGCAFQERPDLPRAARLVPSRKCWWMVLWVRHEAHVASVTSGDQYCPVTVDLVFGLASPARLRQDRRHDRRHA